MVILNQGTEGKIISVTDKKSTSEGSQIIRITFFLLYHYFYCFVIFVEDTMDENKQILGNPLGSPPSLGALYYHFAITQ